VAGKEHSFVNQVRSAPLSDTSFLGGPTPVLAQGRRLIKRSLVAQILVGVLFVVIAGLVIYPIGAVAFVTFSTPSVSDVFGEIPWHQAFNEPGISESILNTFKVVLATQVIALPIAILIAWILGRTDIPFGRIFEFFFWTEFFMPSLSVLTGWLLLFDPDAGIANAWARALGLTDGSPFNLYSFWGIVFVHVSTYGIAVKVMLLTPAFRNLDGSIEEASRVCGASRLQTLVRVVLPLMAPPIVTVLLMSLIRGLETFEIELILGVPINFSVYSTKIFQLMSQAPSEFRVAGMLGITILAIVLPLIIFQRWMSTRRNYEVVTGKSSRTSVRLGVWRWPVFVAMLLLVVFVSVLPLSLLIMGSFMKLFGFFHLPQVWTFSHWTRVLNDSTFVTSLNNMLELGFGTSFLAIAGYSIVAYCVVRLRVWTAGPLDIVSWLPIGIPGIVLGFGYLSMMLKVPFFAVFYGTVGALIFVTFLAAMPIGVQMMKVHMLQIGKDIEEAGRVMGGSWAKTFYNVILPLLVPTLAVVGVMVFASTIRNVSTIMLLSSGDSKVLSILQVEFLSNGSLGPAAVVGTMIMMISIAAALAVRLISRRFALRTR
jgi:iron(III) transport system permease protein